MTDHDDQRRRKRARLACVSCNARRVRCNVTESQPCHNCIAGNVLCETRASRRGKHSRRPKDANPQPPVATEAKNAISPISHTSPRRHEDEVAASHVLASLSSTFHEQTVEQNYNEILGNGTRPGETVHRPNVSHTEHEEDAAVFLGESNALRYVPGMQPPAISTARRSSVLRHSVPNAVKADALMPQWEAERRRARIESLQTDGAFSFPPFATRETLLRAYFKWFHPHFAIVDEPDIWKQHTDGSISPLLMQAMLFIGVIHCDSDTLDNLGWGSRHRAKYLFYTRAKDIYDAEFETKKLTVVQALFLMSHWRAGALLEKDARHWLGAAITLAQTKALHRHAGDLEPRVQSLRRRIWWSIYIRERQCSSSLGLPNRIRDEDCDLEMLSARDFQNTFAASTPASDLNHYSNYHIGMLELARILGKVVNAAYLPNKAFTIADRTAIREELHRWKQSLPPTMQLAGDGGDHNSFQASMLHLAYNNLLILLYRSSLLGNTEDKESDADGNIALQAAARNSRIVEDLLPTGNIGHAQMHVITNLFNTLCIHVAHLRRTSGINKTITEHRAKLCLLGLQDLQKTWEVTNWVLQLFFQYLDRATAARLEMEADDIGITSAVKHAVNDTAAALTMHTPRPASESAGNELTRHQVHTPANNDVDTANTPWSWTTDEANQYLFSQIENDFAFGEGGNFEWSPEQMFGGLGMGNVLTELGYNNNQNSDSTTIL